MRRRRRTRTIIEQREVVIIRRSRQRKPVFCAECAEPIALITVAEAVRLAGINSRAVYRLIEAGQVHFAETADGIGLVCPATLLNRSTPQPRVAISEEGL
jgi:hypothetical protein